MRQTTLPVIDQPIQYLTRTVTHDYQYSSMANGVNADLIDYTVDAAKTANVEFANVGLGVSVNEAIVASALVKVFITHNGGIEEELYRQDYNAQIVGRELIIPLFRGLWLYGGERLRVNLSNINFANGLLYRWGVFISEYTL